ncbi:unnamed protein product [Trifolium pratense]|uniref:Uncharacterized protein n=1 Tax=Trifolium pratense TaxID=57577 RepID=A0ACB0KUM3_TRIPR|nr:unnamed protein product [Trifolium pratense]
MALAACSLIQMPMLRTPNYKSTPIKPMTITIKCAYKGKQGTKDRVKAGGGSGAQKNSILQSTTRNLQFDNIYATNSLSDINDQDDQNTSPRSIGKIDYDYVI